MSDKKTVWGCPCCTRTFRTFDEFRTHLAHKINMLETALLQPDTCKKVINQESENVTSREASHLTIKSEVV